uniref:Uncharacterized protein n=1 Tax=Caenorhabditis japonica TaxID=281687 RepID=A0A8R1IVA5_CAEJA
MTTVGLSLFPISSANCLHFTPGGRVLGMSLTKIPNKTGDSTEPCGTPHICRQKDTGEAPRARGGPADS